MQTSGSRRHNYSLGRFWDHPLCWDKVVSRCHADFESKGFYFQLATDVRFESTCQLPYSEKWSPRLRAVDYGIMAANVSGQVAFITIAEFKELTGVGIGPNKLCCERARYLALALTGLSHSPRTTSNVDFMALLDVARQASILPSISIAEASRPWEDMMLTMTKLIRVTRKPLETGKVLGEKSKTYFISVFRPSILIKSVSFLHHHGAGRVESLLQK